MTRTKLRNCFLRIRSDETRQLFCKQRNKCVSLQRKDYFTSLNKKHIAENKCSWKTVQPFLSSKVQSSERIKLTEEDDTLITNKEEAAMELNDFFSNAVINLIIPKFENFDPLSENIDYPTTDSSKAIQATDIPVKVIKSNINFFAE